MKPGIQWIMGLALLVGLVQLSVGLGNRGDEAVLPQGSLINTEAPSFSLKDLSGKTVSLSDFTGRIVLVNFWASWCPPCVDEIPSLSLFAQKYEKDGVVVLAINVERKSAQQLTAFLAKKPHRFLTLQDPQKKTQLKYGVRQLPESFLVDPHGIIVKKYIGARDWLGRDVVQTVDFLLGG